MNTNEKTKSSDITYPKKETDIDTPAYDWVLRALKKIDTYYNPTMLKINEPIIRGKYKVTRDTRVIIIAVENEENEIYWACNTPISTDAGEIDTLKEVIPIPKGQL